MVNKKFFNESFVLIVNKYRSKDGVVLSVNEEISGDRKKYEILGKYDLIIKTVIDQDSGQYSCQNFDQMLSRNIFLTILSKKNSENYKLILKGEGQTKMMIDILLFC